VILRARGVVRAAAFAVALAAAISGCTKPPLPRCARTGSSEPEIYPCLAETLDSDVVAAMVKCPASGLREGGGSVALPLGVVEISAPYLQCRQGADRLEAQFTVSTRRAPAAPGGDADVTVPYVIELMDAGGTVVERHEASIDTFFCSTCEDGRNSQPEEFVLPLTRIAGHALADYRVRIGLKK
jgi:hypothetical protein